jgi:hypothetical protein
MTCKTIASNGLDSIERVHATDADLDAYLQGRFTVDKQALKAGAIATPIVVETKVAPSVVSGEPVEQKSYNPPQKPAYRGSKPEMCPKCGQNTLYTNETKATRQDGSANPNAGKLFKKCKCGYYDPFQTANPNWKK